MSLEDLDAAVERMIEVALTAASATDQERP